MRPLHVVFVQPDVQIHLQLFQRMIQLATERNLVKLVQNRLVESFAYPIGLWMARFGFSMFNTIDRKIQLIIVRLYLTALFRTSVRQHTDNTHSL